MKRLMLAAILIITSFVTFSGCKKNESGNKLTLNVTAINGTVIKDPKLTAYTKGANVQLTATPNAGYEFTSWSGDATGATNPLTVSMDVNKDITANFTAIVNTYILNVTAANGTVVKNPALTVYESGSSVQLTATPNSGYTFTSWSGDATGATNPLTVSMNANRNIVANFTAIQGCLDVKTKGAKGDGVTDDTAALQAAVDQVAGTGGTVCVPDGTYMVNAITHLNLKSNMTLTMSPNAKLRAIPNNSDSYAVLQLQGISDVTITGGTVQGDFNHGHIGTAGSGHGHGINILGSDHVTITGTLFKNCWGDGLYVGANGAIQTKVLRLTTVEADSNKRQGMSIIHADDVVVSNSIFHRTGGFAPEAGIDIEPNQNNKVNNVMIQNCTMSYNGRTGVTLYKNHAAGFENAEVTNITITGCTIDNNVSASLGSMSGILVDGPTAYTITNNFIRNNGKHGVMLYVTNGSTVTGNTITGNAGYGVVIYAGASNNNVTHNTIQNNTGGGLLDQGTGNTTSPNP